jgi:drug/metabolite transporter (DMT)-like permease
MPGRLLHQGATFGLMLMVLSTLLQACMHALVRHAGTEFHPFVLTFYRNLFGFVVILPLLLRSGRAGLYSSNYRLLFLRGFLGIIALLAWYYSLVHVPLTEATALSFTAVIFTSLAAMVFLRERVRLRRWMAILCGFAGMLIVLRPTTGHFEPIMLLVLFSTLFWALSITVIKFLSRTDSATSLVAWTAILLTLLSLPLALYYWQWPVGEQWLWLLAIGVLGAIGNLCMVRALALADTSAVMTIDFLRLIWGGLIGFYLFGDPVVASTWIGGLLIVASGTYIILRESRLRGYLPASSAPEVQETGGEPR